MMTIGWMRGMRRVGWRGVPFDQVTGGVVGGVVKACNVRIMPCLMSQVSCSIHCFFFWVIGAISLIYMIAKYLHIW